MAEESEANGYDDTEIDHPYDGPEQWYDGGEFEEDYRWQK